MSDVASPRLLPSVAPGTVLAGKYRVERVIGQGGMGVVLEAKHIALDERIALKFLLADHARRPEAVERFLREARAAVKIKSEHVARVSDVGTLETGAPYMVMEYLVGDDLSKVLATSGTFALPDAVDFIIQACEAIAEAHNHGIVHRDLKPANLFLTQRPDGSPLVKVLDFGISKLTRGSADNLTKTTAAMGSALYMSPEQMQETRSVDLRTDIYALGISLFEVLGGKQPFHADSLPLLCAQVLTGAPTPLRSLRPELPDAFAQVLEKAYARDREQRYSSIAEFVMALAPFAPSRTQPTIERIARMGGLAPPPPRAPSPSDPALAHTTPLPPDTTPLPQIAAAETTPIPKAQGLRPSNTSVTPIPHAPPPPVITEQMPGVPPGLLQILPGPYNAPSSARARASFAASALTGGGLSMTGRPDKPFWATSFILVLVFAALVGAIVGVVVLRSTAQQAPVTDEAHTAVVPPYQSSSLVGPEPTPALSLSPSVEIKPSESSSAPTTTILSGAPSPPISNKPPTSIKPSPSLPKTSKSVDLNDPH